MPCLREIDKYAVRCAGGRNHRMRLDDAVLIKDNHISIAGDIKTAITKAKEGNSASIKIQVECDRLEQLKQALEVGVDSVLLDNMSIAELKEAVTINNGKTILEASGNVNLDTVEEISKTGVDYISVGRLTHSVRSMDIGLDIEVE